MPNIKALIESANWSKLVLDYVRQCDVLLKPSTVISQATALLVLTDFENYAKSTLIDESKDLTSYVVVPSDLLDRLLAEIARVGPAITKLYMDLCVAPRERDSCIFEREFWNLIMTKLESEYILLGFDNDLLLQLKRL